ncbi:TPA_asm: L [Erysimum trirhavirus 1]|nr:TPA_asm: L [Erysimum trirhavirus 1]
MEDDLCDLYDEFEDTIGEEIPEYSIPKTKSLRPYHLNSALTPHWLDSLRSGNSDKKLKNSLRDLQCFVDYNVLDAEWSPAQFYLLFGAISIILDPLMFEDDAIEISELLNNAEQLAWQGRTELLNSLLLEGLKEALNTPYYRFYSKQSNFFSTIVLLMNSLASQRNLPPVNHAVRILTPNVLHIPIDSKRHLYVTESIVTGIYDRKRFIMNYDSILMCSDLAKQRRLIMGMTHMGNKIYPENYPNQSTLGELLEIMDNGLEQFGNEFYKVVKVFEPLCVGAIMKTKHDHFVENDEFFKTILDSISEEEPRFHSTLQHLTSFLTSENNPRWISQYFGLYRIWGHPIVDVTAGVKKVMDIGLKETHVNDHTTLEAERHFKYIFLENYRKRHHTYPNYTVLGKQDCWLMKQLSLNKEIAKPGNRWYLSDLDYIDFAETFKPPATFNLTSIIADKAVSPSRTELQGLIKQRRTMDPSIRRGVLKWLRAENVSCKEILKMVNENTFSDDWSIIGVYPKEREENIKPRLFALMSFELRLYVVVTEEMLSDNILGYFPQITMTHSQLDLTKNIFTATRHQSTEYSKKMSNLVTISISMDFEKWNIKMRKSATYRVFRQLGLLFGMENLYTATHDILSRCFIYLADGSYMPNVDLTPDFIHSWKGHLGGFEGLRQKGWTIFTACLIDYVCSKREVSFKLMGQGDNQVVQLIFRLNHTTKGCSEYDTRDVNRIKKITESILLELETIFNSVGMTLKISETWKSSHLFSYGKNMVFDGVPLPLSLKKGARSFYESNEGIMVLDSMMATINTNCQSAAYQDLSHHIAHLVGRYESYVMCRKIMEYHPLLGAGLKTYDHQSWTANRIRVEAPAVRESRKLLAAAMISIPRMMGGYNTTCLFEYIMRGFPDPLTRDLRYANILLQGLSRMDNEDARRLFRIVGAWYDLVPNPTVDRSFLIQDPLALNLLGPKSPMDAMRTAVSDILSSSDVKNRPFKKLLNLKSKSSIGRIADVLWSAKKINARLGHDIYQATPYGYIDQSLARIENTNTIRHLAYKRTSKDIIEVIGQAEVNKYLHFVWKCNQYDQDRVELLMKVCTRRYADQAREQSWKKPLVGVTVPFPDEYLIPNRTAEKISSSDDDGYFIVGFNEHSAGSRDKLISQLGPSPPYLGSVTREKTRQTSDTSVFKAESLIQRPLKLQRAVGWFIPEESNMAKLIHQTLSCVSDLEPTEFKTTDWESTGSHIHRYHDTVTKKGVLVNYSYLPGTHMYLSSDLLVKYSQSKANVTIVYQACLVYEQYLAWVLQLEQMTRGSKPIRAICWSVGCECVQEVDESFDDICDVPDDLLPKDQENDLLWVGKSDLIVYHSSRLRFIKQSEKVPIERYNNDQLTQLFHIYLAKRIAIDIFSGVLTEDVEARMVDSTNRYPRVYYSKMDLNVLVYFTTIWLKTLLIKRIGLIEFDISQVVRVDNLLKDRVKDSNPLCFQGLGLFFTNRQFCEQYLKNPYLPKPNTYPYTLRSIGVAMKDYFLESLERLSFIPLLCKVVPVEFTNLEDEMISVLYFRVLSRKSLCLSCVKEISQLSHVAAKKYCDLHTDLEDIYTDGKIYPKYLPVTVDRLSKIPSRIQYMVPAKVEIGAISVPRCRVLIPNVISSVRTGNNLSCPEDKDKTLPIMGSIWQKYLRAANQPTASRYKWTCVIAEMKRRSEHSSFLIFGDGLGGVSDLTNLFYPNSLITIVSYMNIADAINHSTIGCLPPEYKGDAEKLDVYYQTNKINDVLSPQFREDWENSGAVFDCVLSDIELPRDITHDSYLFYIQNLMSIRAKSIVLKTYLRTTRLSINVLAELSSYYDTVEVSTCSTSNLHYNEVFVYCSNLKARPMKWMYSLGAFESKLDQVLLSNSASSWATPKEVKMLENTPWIKEELSRSYKILQSWFYRMGFNTKAYLDEMDYSRLVAMSRAAIYSYRRSHISGSKKIPYHTMVNIAQRVVAILMMHSNESEILRDHLENPDKIILKINTLPSREELGIDFGGNKGSNKENWEVTLRMVAIGRRLLGKSI